MSARRFWGGVFAQAFLAAALLGLLGSHDSPEIVPAAAAPLGIVAAVVLFRSLARRWPSPPRVGRDRRSLVAARCAVLAVGATCEEAVWRLGLLGSLRGPLGPGAALVLSSAAFAAAHWPRQGANGVAVHAITGAVLGGLYVATGTVVAPIAAHVVYNVLVALAAEASRPALGSTGAAP